jgi:hypothetical protein
MEMMRHIATKKRRDCVPSFIPPQTGSPEGLEVEKRLGFEASCPACVTFEARH